MELTAEEKKILEQTYGRQMSSSSGYNPNQIEKVVELTPEESKFFAQKHFISPYFSMQMLYKVEGEITPIRFSRVIKDMVASDEIFRSNFCEINDKVVKVVFVERRILPEVSYRTFAQTDEDEIDEILTTIMEADRRVNFDLKRGNLIRFAIFKTKPSEFAVLVTMSQLIANHFDAKSFFPAALEIASYKRVQKNSTLNQPKICRLCLRCLMPSLQMRRTIRKFFVKIFLPTFCPTCAKKLSQVA